jgi:transcriptional regulator with XRE-family HTH domain
MFYGNKLKKTRLAREMLQIHLAAKSGINFATLSRIEHGWLKPTAAQKRRLARVLKVSIGELFPQAERRPQKPREGT